ncbi:MAG: DUF2835 family protein [Gammaproteobacteria bacterium]|nr:MAG: DUF2835 family protein [Gammaproteobacteria bacterium]
MGFSLNLSAEQFLPYYQGIVKNIQVVSWDGKTLRFPANILRPYVLNSGIKGDFVLEYDMNNKFSGIRKLEADNSGGGQGVSYKV